jgi:hypothetical protein
VCRWGRAPGSKVTSTHWARAGGVLMGSLHPH